MANNSKWSFESGKQAVTEAFGLLDSYQETIQRQLVACYASKDAARFVEWILGMMMDSPRRKTDGDKLKKYLTGIGAFTFQTLSGVILAEKPSDNGRQRKAYDQMKASFWKTWKPAEIVTMPDLGDGPVQNMAVLLACNAISEEQARMWAEQLVDNALSKVRTKGTMTKVEKLVGAGLVGTDDAGIIRPIRAA